MSAFQRAAVRIAGSGFLLGAAIEYFMIRVQIGSETFYDTVTRLEAQRRIEREQEASAPAADNVEPSTRADSKEH